MKLLAIFMRWAARTIGVLILLLFVIMVVGEGLPANLTSSEGLMFAALAIMIAGIIAAWKWEVIGGFLLLTGFALFWKIEGGFPGGPFFLFPLTGLLHLIAWLLERRPLPGRAA